MSRGALTSALVGVLLLAVQQLVFGRMLADPAALGFDFNISIPLLMAGEYHWLAEGPRSLPWFSPAFCGGVPLLANPENLYLSIFQPLTLLLGPVPAVRLGFLVMSAAGYAGTWALARRFGLGTAGATVAAAAFLFNGFFAHHAIVGHIGFHGFMLAPAIAAALLARPGRALLPTTLAAAGLAYVVISGGVVIAPAVGAAVLLTGAAWHLRRAGYAAFLARFAAASAGAVALAAVRLVPTLAHLSVFSRDHYRLPGADGPIAALRLLGQGLLVGGDDGLMSTLLVNRSFALSGFEGEFALGAVALLLAGAALLRARDGTPTQRPAPVPLATLIGVAMLLVAVNVHQAEWTALLKQVPVVRSSSSLLRWWAAFLVPLCIAAGIGLERVAARTGRAGRLAALACVGIAGQHALVDKSHYPLPTDDWRPIQQAWARDAAAGEPPAVQALFRMFDPDGRPVLAAQRNAVLVNGRSPVDCYWALFGYQLEGHPDPTLLPGPVLDARDGTLSLLRPECQLYPDENECRPGDRFTIDDIQRAEAFTRYQAIAFARPLRHDLAVLGSAGAWGVWAVLVVLGLLRRRRH